MVKNCTNFALSFYAVYKNPHILFDIIQHILPHCKRWGGRAQKYPLSAIIGRKGIQFFIINTLCPKGP